MLAISGEVINVISKDNGRFRVNIIIDRCKECGLCVYVCPRRVLRISNRINKLGYRTVEPAHIERCIGCRSCEYVCPDFAIFIEVVKK